MVPLPKKHETIATIDEFCGYEFRAAKEIDKTFKSQIRFKNMNVLDLGCGLGGQTLYFSSKDTDTAIGIDINKKWIDAAIEYAKKKQSNKKAASLERTELTCPLKQTILTSS